MKKILIIALFAFTCVLQIQAQDALYIYRNDGQFNAFLDEEVDSIVYSKTDMDSVLYNDYVVQEIYTRDSIYRIPLASIDSIGFVTPEVVLQSNVRRIENIVPAYLLAADGMKLFFDNSMPAAERPKVGEILLCLEIESTLLENGFVGRVENVHVVDGQLLVECASVKKLSDVYERLIAVEIIDADNNTASSRAATQEKNKECVLFRLDESYNIGEYSKSLLNESADASLGLNVHVAGECRMKTVYNISSVREYFETTFTNTFDVGASIDIKASLSGEKKELWKVAKVYFPTQFPVFECNASAGFFVRGELSAEWSGGISVTKKVVNSVKYENGNFSVEPTMKDDVGPWNFDFDSDLSINGFFQFGPMVEIYVGTRQQGFDIINVDAEKTKIPYAGLALDIYVGPKFSGSINVDLANGGGEEESRWYDMLKDSKVEIAFLSIDLEGKVKARDIEGEVHEPYTFFNQSWEFCKSDWYLFPEFSAIDVNLDKKKHAVSLSTDVSRNVLFKQYLGFGLYDGNDILIDKKYKMDEAYKQNYNKLETEFTGLRLGQYKVRPLIQLSDFEVPASPSEELSLYLKPFLSDATDINPVQAVLNGYLEGDIEYLNETCQSGFVYDVTENPSLSGTIVFAEPQNGILKGVATNLHGGTKYYFQSFICVDGEYIYSDETKSFTTPIPVELPKVDVTAASYWPGHFTYSGEQYAFKYKTDIYAKLTDDTNVEDWGYVYKENDDTWSELISLKQYNRNAIKDPRQIFYRNADGTALLLKGYATYNGQVCYGDSYEYHLNYPETISLTMANCTFQGTTTDVIYNGKQWKYKSTFRFEYTAQGAYWLKVGTKENLSGNSGWTSWENDLEHIMVECIDGPNATTVSYYYDDKVFSGEYKVWLIGKDETHDKTIQTTEYVIYNYANNQFTGCTFYGGTSAARSLNVETGAEGKCYETTINK